MTKPALLLFPNLLGDQPHHDPYLPKGVEKAVATIDGLIAESEKGGRRFLSRFETKLPTHQVPIALFNKNTPDGDLDFFLEPIREGERWGLVSDGGMPCIADPGSKLVRRARSSGIQVHAFVGPSAILLSLMLSGFPGQRFAFHGYLPKEPKQRVAAIENLEKEAQKKGQTQIFIEAPHRNQHLLEALVATLHDHTFLAVAWDLTLPTQGIVSQKILLWKKSPLPNLNKRAATFLVSTC